MDMAHNLSLLFPEMSLALAAFMMLVAEMLRSPRLALAIGLIGLGAATALTLQVLGADTSVFGGTYRVDFLSGWAKLVLLPGTALALLLVRSELAGRPREGSVYSLMVLVTLGALMLSGAGDMMLLVLGVVLTGLGSFALVAFPRDDAATEAAMKYLVFGSVTGAIMIYGLTFWFGGAGTTLTSALAGLDQSPLIAIAGLIAVIVGLGYKAAVFPFHFWAPDAYQGAPVSVAAYLSVITKLAAFFALAQTLRDLPQNSGWPLAIAALSALTMIFGYLAALVQNQMVRLIAYSSIAQSGYLLLGIVAVGSGALALPSLVVFAGAYIAMNLGAFAVIMIAGRELRDFAGLGRQAPLIGLAMLIYLLSLTGIPPLFGFIGKAYLFAAAMDAGYLWLAVVAIIGSVLALAAYLRIIAEMYKPIPADARTLPRPDAALFLVLAATLAATLFMGLFVSILPG